VSTQSLLVRPDSGIYYPQELANKSVGVNYHAGSHYIALMFLEGFLRRTEIKVVHAGRPLERYEALMAGKVTSVGLMEPWITLAEKNGCRSLGEAHYIGADITAPDLDRDTFEAIARVMSAAVKLFNADKRKYLHYLIEEVPHLHRLTSQASLFLASFSIEIRAARASSGVLTGTANARRTGRGPSLVLADISNPYRSTPVMTAALISVAFEKALQ
jgi:hypothetical protein